MPPPSRRKRASRGNKKQPPQQKHQHVSDELGTVWLPDQPAKNSPSDGGSPADESCGFFKTSWIEQISWSRMLDELILSYLRKNLSVLERGLVGCGRINPCMFNQPFTRRLECVITVDKA